MLDLPSRFISTDGYRTHYLELGEGEPLVLIHGGGAGADGRGNWSGTMPLFAKSMRTIAYDMVGFGNSDAPDPEKFQYTQEARIRQAIAFFEGLKAGPVSVIGNSMGGCTALGVAMRRPDLMKSMVLMGSAGLTRKLDPAIVTIMKYDFSVEGMKKIIDALTHPGFNAGEEMLRYRHQLSIQPAVRTAYGATMAWIGQQGGLYYEEGEIATVSVPTLIFNGKNDRVIPMAEAYRFLELIKGSHGYFLPNCGHWAMIEHPQTFTRISLDFVRGVN